MKGDTKMYQITKEEALSFKRYLEERLEIIQNANDSVSDMIHGRGEPDDINDWKKLFKEQNNTINVLQSLIKEIETDKFRWIK